MNRVELAHYLGDYLQIDKFRDYAPNGLQVQGKESIQHIVTGVTASQALIKEAISCGADALIVHHGYFWKGESQPIVGMKQQRIKTLLDSDINLFAYHLPLDCHRTLGNNVQLGHLLELDDPKAIDIEGVPDLLWYAELDRTITLDTLSERVHQKLGRAPMIISGKEALTPITKIAWCTGGAQNYIEHAAALGAEVYISGEISEKTTHIARELGIHYISAGHHATERYGVQALGEHLKATFGLAHDYIEISNPV